MFHTMFGGRCVAGDFRNMRVGEWRTGGSWENGGKLDRRLGEWRPFVYDAQVYATQEIFPGFEDKSDRALYEVGKQIFWARVNRHRLSAGACRRIGCHPH